MAAENSFDPFVFPYIGVVAVLGPGEAGSGYLRRYAMALTDNSIGNFMTTAVAPAGTPEPVAPATATVVLVWAASGPWKPRATRESISRVGASGWYVPAGGTVTEAVAGAEA